MSDSIYTAVAGAVAAARSMEVVSNNVANTSSTGFKADRVSFKEVLSAVGRQDVANVELAGVRVDFTPGAVRNTGRRLDVSIEGPGFFAVGSADKELYTRAGSFIVSPDGYLSTSDGTRVLSDSGGPIAVAGEPGLARIDEDGTVYAGESAVGRLKVVQFGDAQALRREGANLWSATARAGAEPIDARVRPRTIEASNVNPVSAMTELVMVSRAYEQFHSALEMFRAADQKLVNELR